MSGLKQKLLKLIESLPEGALATLEAEAKKLVPVSPSFTLDMSTHPIFEKDFGPDFELLEEGPQALEGNITWSLAEYLRPSDKEGYIKGDELRKRAVELGGNRGQHDGERIIKLQSKIPIEYRRNHYIPLPGTLYRHRSSQELYVPILDRDGGKWCLGLFCVEFDFDAYGRLLVPGKVALKP